MRPLRLRRVRGEGGQELDGFGGVPVYEGGADPETGRGLDTGLAVAEVGEGGQGLSARAQARHRVPAAGSRVVTAPDVVLKAELQVCHMCILRGTYSRR